MKRLTKKWTTLLLAGVATASLAVATVSATVSADDEAKKTYAITDVFKTVNGGETTTKTISDTKTVYFGLENGETAEFRKNLAYRWKEMNTTSNVVEDKFFTMNFSFEELNFKKVTFTFETTTAVANEDDKAVNAVEFEMKEGEVLVSVINADTKKEGESTGVDKIPVNFLTAKNFKISFQAGSDLNSFKVYVNDIVLTHEFTNVGANFAEYTANKILPMEIEATADAGVSAGVFVKDINGQSFATDSEDKITDTAAPVLVFNEEIYGFEYGTQFSPDYDVVDILGKTTETKEYYQYNPADTLTEGKLPYKSVPSSTTYLMDTVYYTNGTEFSKEKKENYEAKSVFVEDGKEYISVKFSLKDDSNNKYDYDLAWYAKAAAIATPTMGADELKNGAQYIVIDRNDEGAEYNYISVVSGEMVADSALAGLVADYEAKLAEKAEDVYAGSNSSIAFPTLDWLIKDNGGYRGLKFTISYKTPTSTSAKTSSNLSASGLKLTTTEEGDYEFKVFANDKAGNVMKGWLDGEEVEITAENVWEIEAIPSFKFHVKNQGVKVNDPTKAADRKAEKILNQTYTLSGLKVVGSTDEKSSYTLYRFDNSDYKGAAITDSALTAISYEAIAGVVAERKTAAATSGNYNGCFDYLDIYAGLLADEIDGDKAAIKACFKEIKEYNANITEKDPEWEEYNKYNWNPTSKSFKTVEEGKYLIIGDFWEDGLAYEARAGAYKLVIVESEEDVIKGDSKFTAWVKNNVVSVVLFAIAGVMLIAIIVLLFVKPSEETLEDVDAKALKKEKKDEE